LRQYQKLIFVISLSTLITCAPLYVNWEKSNITEAEIKNYLDQNYEQLDPIEGIWSVNTRTIVNNRLREDNPNFGIVAIVKDNSNQYSDFIEIMLSSDNFIPQTITARFKRTAYDNIYISTQYSPNGSKSTYNFKIDEKGILRGLKEEYSLNKQITHEIYYIKLYPKYKYSKNNKSKTKNVNGQATGFLLHKSGLIVTNYHVVENSAKIEVVFPKKNIIKNAELLIKDSQNDIAILRISDFYYKKIFNNNIPFTLADVTSIKVGQKVFTLGFPLGNIMGKQPRLSAGIINSLFGIKDDPRLIQISNPLQPGNSGGPLFNSKGEIVGIVVSGLNAKYFYEKVGIIPQNVNFGIKSNYLSNLLLLIPQGKEITSRKGLSKNNSIEDIVEKIYPFIVQIRVY